MPDEGVLAPLMGMEGSCSRLGMWGYGIRHRGGDIIPIKESVGEEILKISKF